jgi:hypothetical protein
MPRRIDFPLGGIRRKAERQQADRLRRRKLGRVAQAFEQRSRARDGIDRPWLDALSSGRAPFSRKRD